MNEEQKATAGVVGLGVAACAACCAGPIVAAVGVGALGPIGVGVAVLGSGVAMVMRRRSRGRDDQQESAFPEPSEHDAADQDIEAVSEHPEIVATVPT